MKNYVICATLAISGFLSSCHKEKQEGPLIGTWSIKEIARDENGNQVVDESEIKTDGDPALNYDYLFESDGTVIVSHHPDKFCNSAAVGTWEFQNDGKDLEIVVNNTATKYSVQELTNNELRTQSDHQASGLSWMTMKKH